jgi:L-threonylcarbamoyladenylate synthase
LLAAGCPVAAPSANKAGHVSPTNADHVAADLGDGPEIILDGGFAAFGLESTVVDLSGEKPALLRPGAIPRQEIERLLRTRLGEPAAGDKPSSPGQLRSHYAPRAKVRLGARSVKPREALLAFGGDLPPTDGPMVNLSPDGDLREAAVLFFAAMRELDASGCETIAVMPIPDEGLGEAINDRLRRAAVPREKSVQLQK